MELPHEPFLDSAQIGCRQPELLSSVMPSSGKGKGKRLRDWEVAETSVLLECVNLPQFRHQKRKQSYMKWDAIAEEIRKRLVATDSAITGKRCKERMKTLKGYYQQVQTKKKRADVTEDERHKSNGLAVDWWYSAIGDFRGPREEKSIRDARKAHHIAQQFNSLNDSQRSTFLDLYSATNTCDYVTGILTEYDSISDLLKKLSLMQNRRELSIYEDVIALKKLGLVQDIGEVSADDDEAISELYIDFERLGEHKRFFEKVMRRNPVYDTHRIIKDKAMVTFDARFAPSGIRVLNLVECMNLEVVDLSGFGKLRVLFIYWCQKLREMIGCEGLDELRWLEIRECPGYDGYPPLQKFPNLQEFLFRGNSGRGVGGGVVDVSGCVRLRKLTIWADGALSSIRGLEGLRSLTALDLSSCKALQNIPDIGHMKELTRLDVSGTATEEIKGVEKLSNLKELRCSGSKLKTLPDLSHLPQLKFVQVHGCPATKDPSSPFFGKDRVMFNHEIKHVDVSDVSDSDSEQDDSSES